MNDRENEILSHVIELLCQKLNPAKIILFGSRVKKRPIQGHPDFDLAVDAPVPPLDDEIKIKDEIEKIAGLHKVDIVYLEKVDQDFKQIILKTGKVVYER